MQVVIYGTFICKMFLSKTFIGMNALLLTALPGLPMLRTL